MKPKESQKRTSDFVKKAPYWFRQYFDSDLKMAIAEEREAQKAKVLKRMAIKKLEEKNEELLAKYHEIDRQKALLERLLWHQAQC